MPAKKKGKNLVGSWAFLIGVILALIFSFLQIAPWVTWTLVIIGVIIGLLNITVEEVQPFLLAGAVLVIVAAFGGNPFEEVGISFLTQFLNNMLSLFVPATIIVALRSLWRLGRA